MGHQKTIPTLHECRRYLLVVICEMVAIEVVIVFQGMPKGLV